MLLIHDRPMGEYGIEDDGVVHCVITEASAFNNNQWWLYALTHHPMASWLYREQFSHFRSVLPSLCSVPTPHPQASQTLNLKGLANPANALLVATGTGLYGLWVLLYHYPHLFPWKTIAVLSAFSAAHVSIAVVRFTAAA